MAKGVHFVPDRDIPSLKGKVILVTGGNTGLGKESILQFSKHGPKEIWMGSRSTAKAQEAINDIKAKVPNAPPIKILPMDLTSFATIREAAKTFLQQSDRLDILLLNAGIMSVPEGTTKDGYEIQFGTNQLGHSLLFKLLLPVLEKTADLPGSDVRIVSVSSGAHQYAPADQGIIFTTLKGSAPEISSATRYGQSKLANLLFAQEVARRYPKFTSSSLHPGVIADTNLATTMSQNSLSMRIGWKLFAAFVGVDIPTGALGQLWASTSKDVKSGEYYYPVGKLGMGKKWSNDPALAKKLWDWTEKELKDQTIDV